MDMTSAKSIREGQFITIQEPVRIVATTGTDEAKKILQEGYDMKYQAEIAIYLKRVDMLKANATKAYAMIMDDYCTKAMKTRIQEHPDYATVIQDNPFKLLETIKAGMHEPLRAQYPFVSKVDTCRNSYQLQTSLRRRCHYLGQTIQAEPRLDYRSHWQGRSRQGCRSYPGICRCRRPTSGRTLNPRQDSKATNVLDIKESVRPN